MTNKIVAQAVADVEAAANTARAIWDAAVITEQAAWATGNMQTIRTAQLAQIAARANWKAGERALQDMWLAEVADDEEMRLQAMCEAYDAIEWDYADYRPGFVTEPIPYALTPAGMTYLDHHYQNDSDGGHEMVAADGDSPYGDGTTGWDQPAPLPYYYQGTPDLDERDRLENLAY